MIILSILLVLSLILGAYLIIRLRQAVKSHQALQCELRQIEHNKIRAETELRALKETVESERIQRDNITVQMRDAFKSLAAQALEGNTKQFFAMAKSTLENETKLAASDLDKRQQSIHSLVTPLKEVLDKYHGHIAEIEKARERSYTNLESELKRVVDTSHNLAKETAALKDALKRPHIRGRWGEVQLRNCIELAGMSEYADVTFQDTTSGEDGQRLIPDMTVKMPGGHVVIVDAKTPIDAFLNSLEASTEEERATEMARHGRHVKEHVKKLSGRAYAEALPDSADFTVMFLPNESFLYAALELEPDLVEYALQRKVLIATPPTLIGLLKVIRYGWNEEKLAENAQRISDAGIELHKRVCDFVDAYTSIGKNLDKAKQEYDKGWSRLNSRVLVQARRLEKLGAKSNKQLPMIEATPAESEAIVSEEMTDSETDEVNA